MTSRVGLFAPLAGKLTFPHDENVINAKYNKRNTLAWEYFASALVVAINKSQSAALLHLDGTHKREQERNNFLSNYWISKCLGNYMRFSAYAQVGVYVNVINEVFKCRCCCRCFSANFLLGLPICQSKCNDVENK